MASHHPRPWRARSAVAALGALALLASACGRDSGTATDLRAPEGLRSTGGSAPAPTQPPSAAAAGTTAVPRPVATAPPTTSPASSLTLPPATTTVAAAPAGAPHPVTTTVLPLVDTSRPTISRGRTISTSRSLPTTVYYPSDGGGPYPLVVFAHGFEIGPGPYARLCEKIAAAGYVVAAPSFPLTDKNVAGASLDRGDLPNQAGDVGFVITAVSAAGGPLAGKVDGGKVGVVGHSDGADTALDVGYFPLRTDARVRGVVAFAPDAMTGPGGSVGSAPLLLEHGDRDSIVPYSNSVKVFGQVKAHRFFMTLLGADHLPPVQGAQPWAAVHEQVVVDFLDRYVAGRTSTDDAILQHGNHPSVSTITTAS